MNETPALPDYSEVSAALIEMQSDYNPSQIHGLFCGYICATSGKINREWEKLLFGKHQDHPAKAQMQQLYEISYHQMSEFSFEFSLLLPDDNTDINARAEALGLWCQGFLTGLEQSTVSIQKHPDSEIQDALHDLVEIAQVNFGDMSDSDEDETAYFELVEYVRLSALMIFHELKKSNPNAASDENNVLH